MSFFVSGFFASMLSFLAVYAALTVVLHLQANVTGIVNFGIAGFWGMGMYLTALFLLRAELPFVASLILASVITGLVAIPLGRVVLNLDGQAVLVATLAFGSIVENLIFANRDLTGGSTGLGTLSMPFAAAEGYKFILYALVVVGFLALLIVYAVMIKKAPFGRLLFSIRDNEMLSRTLGKPTLSKKIIFFGVTCGVLGFFGGLTAPLHSYLLPMMVGPFITFTAWIAMVTGGQSKLSGAVVGVIATVFMFDYVLNIILPIPPNFAQIVPFLKYAAYGLMLVLLLMFRPTGIMGAGSFLKKK